MRILLVSQYFWPENFRINELATELRNRGHEITVLTGIPNYPKGSFSEGYGYFRNLRQDYQGVRIVRCPLVPRFAGRGWQLALNYLSFAFLASVLGPLYCRGKYDSIFVYEPSPITVGIPAIILRALKRIPLAFWVQDLWPESLVATGAVKSRWILDAVGKLVGFIYRRCDLILVQSRAFRKPVESYGITPERIRYFPNSAETFYRPVEPDQALARELRLPEGFRIMFAGNIGAAQDFETILAAAERLRAHERIHWLIVGDGRMRGWVEAEIRKRGLECHVHLLGSHPAHRMPAFFSLADAMLVTLKEEPIFALTIPAKVQSYLACAKPIVAALSGEGARVIDEARAGFAGAAENAGLLAENVLRMSLESAERRAAMGAAGLSYFNSHFERELLLKQFEGFLSEVILAGKKAVS